MTQQAKRVFTCPETDDLTGTCNLCGRGIRGHGADYECLSQPAKPAGHTPTPWNTDNNALSEPSVFDKDGNIIAVTWLPDDSERDFKETQANAAFIVRACNGWDNPKALRARLKELENAK